MKNLKIVLRLGFLLSTAPTIMYPAAAAEPATKRSKIDTEALLGEQAKNIIKIVAETGQINDLGEDGMTLLMVAALYDSYHMAKVLLEYKADANVIGGQKKTALMCASKFSKTSTETLKLLLRSGADFTIPGTQGKRTIREILTEEFKSEKRVVFDQHISYLELLMGRYNEAVIKNEIKDKKRIEDLTSAQHHVTKMEKELFELELSPLFNELSLVANKTGRDSLFQHFKE